MIKLYPDHNTEEVYNQVIGKTFPDTDTGKDGPTFEEWSTYIKKLGQFVEIYQDYFATLPTKTELNQIRHQMDKLTASLYKHEAFEKRMQDLFRIKSVIRTLIDRRANSGKTPTIATDINIMICTRLFQMWYKTFKALPTGTYNWRLDHGLDREELDKFDYNKNPGGFYIQTAFSEYFAIKLDNKQTKDLIQITTKGLALPLDEPHFTDEISTKNFPYLMGWAVSIEEDTFVPHSKEELERRAKEKKK